MLANRAAPRQLLHHLYRLAPACVRAWMPAATLHAAGPERELYWLFELKKKPKTRTDCKKSDVVPKRRSYHCTRAIGRRMCLKSSPEVEARVLSHR